MRHDMDREVLFDNDNKQPKGNALRKEHLYCHTLLLHWFVDDLYSLSLHGLQWIYCMVHVKDECQCTRALWTLVYIILA